MATDAITGSGYDALAAGTSAADQSTAKLAKDMDTFLTMLTTQLKHQDPLSPMDSTEFTNQLVQFASVEQSIATNKNLESLIAMQSNSATSMAVGYLDQVIETQTSYIPLENGKAQFSYALSSEAKDVSIAILDDTGSVVQSVNGATSAGKHIIQWDGTDTSGVQLPDGLYTMQVTPTQLTDEPITVATTAWGNVNGIRAADGTTYLSVGAGEVSLENVLAVTSANAVGSTISNATSVIQLSGL